MKTLDRIFFIVYKGVDLFFLYAIEFRILASAMPMIIVKPIFIDQANQCNPSVEDLSIRIGNP